MNNRNAKGKISLIMRNLLGKILGNTFIPPGVKIGKSVFIGQDVKFDGSYNDRLITIDDDVTIVGGTRILCHDASSNRRIRATWMAPVKIGKRAFIGADAIILPGVKIGEDAIVGAGAVVTHDVPPGVIVAGVPSRIIGKTSDLDARRLSEMKVKRVFDFSEFGDASVSQDGSDMLCRIAESKGGFFISGSKAANEGKSDDKC